MTLGSILRAHRLRWGKLPGGNAMNPGGLVKVVVGTVRRGETGTLVEKEYVALFGLMMWKVAFDGGQTGLYSSGDLRKVG